LKKKERGRNCQCRYKTTSECWKTSWGKGEKKKVDKRMPTTDSTKQPTSIRIYKSNKFESGNIIK
jgi:hypothetical protein